MKRTFLFGVFAMACLAFAAFYALTFVFPDVLPKYVGVENPLVKVFRPEAEVAANVLSNDEEKPKETESTPQETNVPLEVEEVSVPIELQSGIGDNVTITRGLAARCLAMLLFDGATLDALSYEGEVFFADCDEDFWLTKYINALKINNLLKGVAEDENFDHQSSLTINDAQNLVENINPQTSLKMTITEENDGKAISYALWAELFTRLALELSSSSEEEAALAEFGLSKRQIIPMTVKDGTSLVADVGAFGCEGFELSSYVDAQITVIEKNGSIVLVLSVDNFEPTINNAYVLAVGTESITVFSGGTQRSYKKGDGVEIDGDAIAANVRVKDGVLTGFEGFAETKTGILKRSDASMAELDNGKLVLDEHFKVYNAVDKNEVGWARLSNIIVGTDIADFIVKDGVAKAAVIRKRAAAGTLRVSIGTSGFKGFEHNNVTLSANAAFEVKYGSTVKQLQKDETFEVSDDIFSDGVTRLYAKAENNGKIILKSVRRNWGNDVSPAYSGTIEVSKSGNGFFIVNELPLEQYLYAVIPSEMPTSYGLEAAKVQAVTARSFAVAQYFANSFHKYGGNVDDSVSCQVYNNTPENETSIRATDETKGLCLTYNGNVISANFFSSSSGMTANSGEVWSNGNKFPAASSKYLSAKPQTNQTVDYGDLRLEENAAKFFKATDVDSYDNYSAWFRWNTTMTAEQLSASINAVLRSRYDANPRMIKTLTESGKYLSRPVDTIGTLLEFEVKERGEGGNIISAVLTGTKATVLVYTEYNIRALLSPYNYDNPVIIYRKDGSEVKNYSILPSAFFTVDKTYNEDQTSVKSLKFYGGGNGHGVGMSQSGVKGMIDRGFSFEQILNHFYTGTQVKQIIG